MKIHKTCTHPIFLPETSASFLLAEVYYQWGHYNLFVFVLPTQRFVPDLPWQPIPVHTVPTSEDTVRLSRAHKNRQLE